MSELSDLMAASMAAPGMMGRQKTLLVAVSGGLDSMVLLHLLGGLTPPRRWRLTVAHFNHQLRGGESEEDERFVAETATRMGVRFVSDRGDVRERMRTTGVSLEMAARELRHEFFGRMARALKISRIAMAHHVDDQVELFFLRLFRGAGGAGLGGMRMMAPAPFNPRVSLLRPLLGVPKRELEMYAQAHQVRYREDSSNALLEIPRNRIRHQLIPLLERDFELASRAPILRTLEITGTESAFVLAVAQDWLASAHRAAFETLHVAVQRQCLRLQLEGQGLTPDFTLVEHLRLYVDRPIGVEKGHEILRDREGFIQLRQPAAPFRLEEKAVKLGADGSERFGRVSMQWEVVLKRGDQRTKPVRGCECFDADKVGETITLRLWRPGDRFQPIGAGGPAKLQNLFTNLKVPRDRRRELLVACTEAGTIFWVEGLRIGEIGKLTPGTRRRLMWRWERDAEIG